MSKEPELGLTPSDSDLAKMTIAELRNRLADGLRLTAVGIELMGRYWRELERRGEDLSELRAGVGRYIPLVAAGRLSAHAVVSFIGYPSILRVIEGLPVERQRQLADGAAVQVYDAATKTTQSIEAKKIPPGLLSAVFADGRELGPKEQALVINSRKVRSVTMRTVRVNRAEGTIRIGNSKATIAQVIAALSEAAGCKGVIDPQKHALEQRESVTGQVTDQEKDRVRAAVKAMGLTESELVRRAVMAILV